MGIEYVLRTKQILTSDVLGRDVFIDEISDLSDHDLNVLAAETEVVAASLKVDHDELPPGDQNRVHIRHKRNIFKAYRQAAQIERKMRGIDAAEKFFDLVAERIGFSEADALRKRSSVV